MIDGELKDSSEALDAFGKKKKPKASSKGSNAEEIKTLHVSLYIPCVSLLSFTLNLRSLIPDNVDTMITPHCKKPAFYEMLHRASESHRPLGTL
jgi:hypothetical protein